MTRQRWQVKKKGNRLEGRYYSEKEFFRCAIKFRHTDYFSALLQARSMLADRPLSKPQIYECIYCDGLHLTGGTSHKDVERLKKSLANLEKQTANPGYIAKAPVHVKRKDAMIMAELREQIAARE
jgi:hypothetical protein